MIFQGMKEWIQEVICRYLKIRFISSELYIKTSGKSVTQCYASKENRMHQKHNELVISFKFLT